MGPPRGATCHARDQRDHVDQRGLVNGPYPPILCLEPERVQRLSALSIMDFQRQELAVPLSQVTQDVFNVWLFCQLFPFRARHHPERLPATLPSGPRLCPQDGPGRVRGQ